MLMICALMLHSQNRLKLFLFVSLGMMDFSMKQSLRHERAENQNGQQHEEPRWGCQRENRDEGDHEDQSRQHRKQYAAHASR